MLYFEGGLENRQFRKRSTQGLRSQPFDVGRGTGINDIGTCDLLDVPGTGNSVHHVAHPHRAEEHLSRIVTVYLLQGLKLQIYRLRRLELLSWVPLIPLQKFPAGFSPEGLRKYPISWGFFLKYYSLHAIFESS
jgi:hypothetical protein